ncbi:pyridoxal-phosphate dependent enzyme [Candidatus Wolfebacteria bacterium]|nr:pyridoxal-phosphate dependent enzyme [Candidatus Wolfebacteria bacterium]
MPERDENYIRRLIDRSGLNPRDYFDEIRHGNKQKEYPYGSGVFMWSDFILPGFPSGLAVSLREGMTDLFELPKWLKKSIGLNNLFLKMEGQNPSGSFKDRGMPVAVSWARYQQECYPELGIIATACASTGDTSASASKYTSYHRNKLRCVVFLPFEKIALGQLAQAMMSQAIVIAVKHPTQPGFDSCMKLIGEFCSKYPKFVMVNSANAFRIIGQESIALEICQDFGWNAPDWIAIPCGNGGNLTALMLSLLRQRQHGLIDRLPGIIVGQTKNSNPLVRWAESGFRKYEALKKEPISVASAMDIQDPVSFSRIKRLFGNFDMLFYDVGEQEINETGAIFNGAGADVCPQGAVAIRAVLQARMDNKVKENDTIAAMVTATNLKFIDSAVKYHMSAGEVSESSLVNPYRLATTGTVEEIANLVGL